MVKTSKLYFYDTGLLNFLLGIKAPEDLLLDKAKGNVFENLIISEHLKSLYHLNMFNELYFWQDSNGIEIDLLWKKRDAFFAIEVKATHTIRQELFNQLDKFESLQNESVQKILIYGGNHSQKRTNYLVRSWSEASDGSML